MTRKRALRRTREAVTRLLIELRRARPLKMARERKPKKRKVLVVLVVWGRDRLMLAVSRKAKVPIMWKIGTIAGQGKDDILCIIPNNQR